MSLSGAPVAHFNGQKKPRHEGGAAQTLNLFMDDDWSGSGSVSFLKPCDSTY